MQCYWFNKQNNKKLIVFFCGWSFDYNPFKFLDCGNYDVVTLYDYADLNFDIDFSGYEEIHLISWSMGVFIASYLREKLPALTSVTAVCGTPFPVDDELGIPHKPFELSLLHAETGLQGKFTRNVFVSEDLLKLYNETPVARSIENRVQELVELDKLIKSYKFEYSPFYTKALVGVNDKIIPAKNQLNFWGKFDVPVVKLDCGHFPFYNYKSWEEILLCK